MEETIFGIDAWSANGQTRSGVEWYAFYLLEAMKKQTLFEGERVFLYSPTFLEEPLATLPTGWEQRVLRWALPRGWMQGRVSWEMRKRTPNVLFVPAQGLPRLVPNDRAKRQATVATVHDIGFLHRPDVYPAKDRLRLQAITNRTVKKATHLITVSEFSKRELMKQYQLPSERISVTPLAANTAVYYPRAKKEVAEVLNKHRLGPHYFLWVGRLDKKKNLETLLHAFTQFKEHQGMGDPFELVLVGSPGFGFEGIKRVWESSSVARQIRHLGYLPEQEIAALMTRASAYVFPSWYEGFGIPNVEAMSCGAPLIISDIPAHREVVGDAAWYVSPNDPSAWARLFKKIVDDPKQGDLLREKGFVQAAQYSWEQTATKTWEILREVIS
jgi:glycosyltransferase involved in cell wall biosynthesis